MDIHIPIWVLYSLYVIGGVLAITVFAFLLICAVVGFIFLKDYGFTK